MVMENGEVDGVELQIPRDGEYSKVATKEDEEKEKMAEKPKEKIIQPVGICEFFRFTTLYDRVCLFIAVVASMALGMIRPTMLTVIGATIDVLHDKTYNLSNQTTNPEKFLSKMNNQAINLAILGVIAFFLAYLQSTLLVLTASRQCHRIRNSCFASIMRQDIGWFDEQKSGELNTRLSSDMEKIQEGQGEKMGMFIQNLTGAIAGVALGFVYNWKLTLVILSVSPIMVLGVFLMSKLTMRYTTKELRSYAKAGAIAEEVLGAIRTVAAFGGEKREADRYVSNLHEAKSMGMKKGLSTGLSMGVIWFIIYIFYALGFWYGAKLVREDESYVTGGTVLVVFISIMISAACVGHIVPNMHFVTEGRAAAAVIFALIDRESAIDYTSKSGSKKDEADVVGELTLDSVSFHYPTRPDVPILDLDRLVLPAGKTTALVGSSGSGKSTVVGLIQRFYDPLKGSILMDDVDIRSFRLDWYRSLIGIVSQEPVLFACSIRENIAYGRLGVSDEDVENAAIMANAHEFIIQLPLGYDTLLGDRGAQLSGGQKQRIAIARALVRNPKILLLDEATSALDTESESIVQAALEKASEGRTTVVIAHRLSTVRNADLIVGMDKGRVCEVGTHDELMAKEGIYHKLVTSQTHEDHVEEDDEEDELLEISLVMKRMQSRSESFHKSFKGSASIRSRRSSTLRSRLQSSTAEEYAPDGSKAHIEDEMQYVSAGFCRLMRMNASEWYWIVLGSIGSLINGVVQPTFAVVLANILTVIMEPDPERQKRLTAMFSFIFFGLAIVSFLSFFLQGYMFSRSGEALTMRCRDLMFRAYLRQDVSFFDWPMNNLGATTTRLATDASLVQGASGIRLGTFIASFSALGGGIAVAFIYSWKLALVILAFVPLLVLTGAVRVILLQGSSRRDKGALEEAGRVSVESIENIRTVVGLQLESTFIQHYREKLLPPYRAGLKRVHFEGIAFSLTQAVAYLTNAAGFYYGGILVKANEIEFRDVMTVFGALIFGAMAVGQAAAFAPDAGKARAAAKFLFWLIDREPEIDSSSTEGSELHAKTVEGRVTLRNVRFRYPTRPQVPVLRGIDVDIQPGENVALVGSSGCGKSTVIQLLERFYDVLDGTVCIDGMPVTELRLSSLRSVLSLVSQEPVLFDLTIAENIAYGDNSREPDMQEIIEAARNANIHDFIVSLPDGYDTMVGEKGGQLSGGQKQRIAIARALIRNPKILLLDEATSALDTESEKVVQEALDNAQQGRTSITIAHRLSTIRDADRIIVIHRGRVREIGTHAELINHGGIYFNLVSAQTGAS